MSSSVASVPVQIDKYASQASTVEVPNRVADKLNVTCQDTVEVAGRTTTVAEVVGTTSGDTAVVSGLAGLNADVNTKEPVEIKPVEPPAAASVTLNPINEAGQAVAEALDSDTSPVAGTAVAQGDYFRVEPGDGTDLSYFEVDTVAPAPVARFDEETAVDLVRLEPDDRPRSILTPDERVELRHPSYTVESFEAITARFRQALHDLQLLARYLPDEALRRVSTPEDETYGPRGAVQDVLSLLYLGLDADDDDVEARFAEAIRHAEATRDVDAHVTLDVAREETLPADVVLGRLREHGLRPPVTFTDYERVERDQAIPPEEVVDALEDCDEFTPRVIELEMERAAASNTTRHLPSTAIIELSTDDNKR